MNQTETILNSLKGNWRPDASEGLVAEASLLQEECRVIRIGNSLCLIAINLLSLKTCWIGLTGAALPS